MYKKNKSTSKQRIKSIYIIRFFKYLEMTNKHNK